MKGVIQFWMIAVAIIGLLVVANNGGLKTFSTLPFNGCTWDPDYSWVSCVQTTGIRQTLSGGLCTSTAQFLCPGGADVDSCKLEYVSSGSTVRSCSSVGGWLCDCYDSVVLSLGDVLPKGRVAQLSGNGVANIQVYKKELRYTGTAGTGYGSPVTDAQGCSWKPQGSTLLDGNNNPVDTVPTGQSYKYVSSQHLVSCPQECVSGVDDKYCSVPTSVRSGTTNYNGKVMKYYVTSGQNSAQVNIVGCKTTDYTVCLNYSADRTTCNDERPYGECGTIDTLDGGSCAQNSDCGDTTRYKCNWDSINLKGTCTTIDGSCSTCSSNFDCTQTAPTCNNFFYGSSQCVSGCCKVVSTKVSCCSSSDCSANYFCNSQHICELSQQQKAKCPVGKCCEGDPTYEDRLCSDLTGGSKNVCCGDGTCASTIDTCNVPPKSNIDWFLMIVIVLGLILAILVLPKLIKR